MVLDSSSSSEAVAVAVAIRVRPLSPKEEKSEPALEQSWKIDTANNFIQMNENSYQFDHVFGTSASTSDVYTKVAKDVVTSSMQGINGTIFAYGQTGSGKTFTMQGSRESPGVIPHAISDVFQFIQNNPSREFCLRVSYLEIYNEILKDLLDPSKVNLKIHENPSGGLFVGDLTEKTVMGPVDVMELLMKGQSNRYTAATNMNEASSRSHSIFKLVIESRQRPNLNADEDDEAAECVDGGISVASLHLVDLAGSERVAHTGARGVRLKEGAHINKSLLTLGNCIRRLSEGESGHIPYRDSKLTRILSPALGGNTRTLIVCNVTSASLHVDETLSTLGFASRAKTIQNSVHKNEIVDSETQIRRLEREIAGLRVQLEARAESASVPLRQECAEKSLALQEARKRAQALQRFLLSAATLQDSDIDAGAGYAHGATELSLSRSNQSRRRRTFDPASFSTPALNHQHFVRRAPLLPPSLAPTSEESRSSVGSITSDVSSTRPASEIEALSFRVSQLQSERDQAVEDVAQMKKEFVNLNETHAQELSKLDSEKKFLVSRCAVSESKQELMDIRLKDFDSLKEERKQMLIDLQEAKEQKKAADQQLLTFRETELKWNESVRKLKESGERESLLEQKAKEMQSRINSLQAKCQQSQTESNNAIDVRKQLSEELLVWKRRTNELSESNELLHAEKEVVEMSLKEAEQQSASANGVMSSELEVMSARVSTLETELSSRLADLTASQALAREQAAILRLPASKQERAARNAADKAMKAAENKLSQLRAKVDNLESVGREHVRERQVSTGQRQALERQLKALERQLNLKDKQLQQSTQVQNNTKAMQNRIEEVESENESLKHEIDEKTHELMELKSLSGAVNRELSASRRELEEMQDVVSQLNPVRTAYEEASRELASARASLAESEALVRLLNEQNNDANALRTQFEALRQSHAELQKAKAAAEEHVLEAHLKLEEAAAKADARIQLLSSEKVSVCGELRETRVLLSNQQQAFEAYQQRQRQALEEEQLQRTKQQQHAKEHEQRMNNAVNKLDEAEQEKLILQQQNQQLEDQLRQAEREKDKQESLLRSANAERQTTESELVRFRALHHTLTDTIETLKADKTAQQTKIERVSKRYESTLKQLRALQEQESRSEQELPSPPLRPSEAAATVEAQRKEIKELQETTLQLRKELEHKKKHPLSSKQMLQLVQASKRYALLKEQASKENKP